MDYVSVMGLLAACHGPSGDEGQVAAGIQRLAEPYADECWRDTMGNLIVHRRGPGPKVLFAAHMDSIGLIVTHIDQDGCVSFGKLGGVRPESILHTTFRFKNGVKGVVALREGASAKEMSVNDLHLDIGAKDEAQARRLVRVAPHLDGRIGCVAMLEALGTIRAHSADLYFVFTVQEELGRRGSRTAAFALAPDYAVAVDVTTAQAPGGGGKGSTTLGGGAAIKVMDGSVICHREVVQILEALAVERGIPCQKDVLTEGGTDAGSIQISRGGVLTGGISIPCRYVHSPVETVDMDDVSAAARLIAAFAERDFDKI